MSYLSTADIEQVILPSTRDLGGFSVRRALPAAMRQMVGPFIFLDSFGPVRFGEGEGIDTRPHPHIGLSTLTYLLEGELLHRDSESYVQSISPGEVNMMVAGSGIVHSERTPDDVRHTGGKLTGLQSWIALPRQYEETDPLFQHLAADTLPGVNGDGITMKLLAGTLHGSKSPAATFSDLFSAEIQLQAGGRYRIDGEHVERAIFVVSGSVEVAGQDGTFGPDRLIVFKPGAEIVVKANEASRFLAFGGEPLPEKRFIRWNFVATDQERIRHAADLWRKRRFPGVPGDDEFIPLPDNFS
ncbi:MULTISPECIES: pirin family protein [Ensifer]|jgi:redox-sensitive bicupin YhaK (pirin superfamily)|uniref:pirin family protein n=1 Tax=Ensifer TaxID=106591 RepID=UPI00070D8E26|nr:MULTISPECIES: pirin family protein [Ensifer]KQW34769.1 pirin [Ensifer sp. Root1252]KQW68307.1 pirin [Ensifer sp. Root127]KRC57095.1 pirin [Ensifer sp. Root231]KRC87590.1 pirin [Ensifer sp. Root258]NOV19890.1 pirin family protein [Ensifer canadensis]